MARSAVAPPETLARIEKTKDEDLRIGDEVIFLVDSSDNGSITLNAGRRGSVMRASVFNDGSPDSRFYAFGESYGSSGKVEHVAKIVTRESLSYIHRPQVDDRVLLVTGDWAGNEAVISAVPALGTLITVHPLTAYGTLTGHSVGVTKWVPLLPVGVAAWWWNNDVAARVEPEEIPELPDYWRNRLISFAKTAKRKHGWCVEIDKLTRQILEPSLPKFQVESHEVLRGFSVIDPQTEDMVAWFATEDEATKDAETRTKKLAVTL